MRPFFVLASISLLLMAGCTAQRASVALDSFPELIDQAPLPSLGAVYEFTPMRLRLLLFIDEEGKVRHATFLDTSGNKQWDSLAVQIILSWEFMPAYRDGRPIAVWIQQPVVVRFQEPLFLPLAEIVCRTRDEALHVYQALRADADFDSLASLFSIAPSRDQGGRLGRVNVYRYPSEVHRVLENLRDGSITQPLSLGGQFVIFKRMRAAEPREFAQ